MLNEVDAVYENGVLRPLEPLLLAEHERVRITVAREQAHTWLDQEFMEACRNDADAAITLEQVRASLGKIRGSMDKVINEDRGEF